MVKLDSNNKNPRSKLSMTNYRITIVVEFRVGSCGGGANLSFVNRVEQDLYNVVNTINTAIQETANDVTNKQILNKQVWVPYEILELCDSIRK